MTFESFLSKDIIVFMNWFKQNSLKANPEKFQTMLISSYVCDVDGLMFKIQYPSQKEWMYSV